MMEQQVILTGETILSFPILALLGTLCWQTLNPPVVNLALCFDFLVLNLGGLTGLPFLLPFVDLKKF